MNAPLRRAPVTLRAAVWRSVVFVHRWLGVAGCLLFLVWFVSGIAMIYVRMPVLTVEETLAQAAAIDATAIQVAPAAAAVVAGADAETPIEMRMLGSRPVYRFGRDGLAGVVFADTGERLTAVTAGDAEAAARQFVKGKAAATVAALTAADQWTLQLRPHFPLYRVAFDDRPGTAVYVSRRTGALVLDTTRRERFWAYVGPVAHWLYLPVLRRHGEVWTQVIVWTSAAGCLLCVSGLAAGIWRLSIRRRYTIRRQASATPYDGWLRWHHYSGLLFGLVALTWTFSGLLSMDPFPQLSSEGITSSQRRSVAGVPPPLATITVGAVRDAVQSARVDREAPRALRLLAFGGRWYWRSSTTVPASARLLPAEAPAGRSFEAFPRAAIESAAVTAAPGGARAELTWLTAHDEYYYARREALPLPVLRARYADADATWAYLDPAQGTLVRVVRRPDRWNRWLYNGLHSLDPAWLRNRRPWWDVVVVLLLLGGGAGVMTSLIPAARRLGLAPRRR